MSTLMYCHSSQFKAQKLKPHTVHRVLSSGGGGGGGGGGLPLQTSSFPPNVACCGDLEKKNEVNLCTLYLKKKLLSKLRLNFFCLHPPPTGPRIVGVLTYLSVSVHSCARASFYSYTERVKTYRVALKPEY